MVLKTVGPRAAPGSAEVPAATERFATRVTAYQFRPSSPDVVSKPAQLRFPAENSWPPGGREFLERAVGATRAGETDTSRPTSRHVARETAPAPAADAAAR